MYCCFFYMKKLSTKDERLYEHSEKKQWITKPDKWKKGTSSVFAMWKAIPIETSFVNNDVNPYGWKSNDIDDDQFSRCSSHTGFDFRFQIHVGLVSSHWWICPLNIDNNVNRTRIYYIYKTLKTYDSIGDSISKNRKHCDILHDTLEDINRVLSLTLHKNHMCFKKHMMRGTQRFIFWNLSNAFKTSLICWLTSEFWSGKQETQKNYCKEIYNLQPE